MQPEIIQKLLTINRQFYQTFAADFDATRQRIQPGVARVLDMIPREARILDLGCGNGELARELSRGGFVGKYVGIDFSEGLIEAARKYEIRNTKFEIRDLTAPDWDTGLEGPFDVVFAFAVFHHLPGPFHAEIVRKIHPLLACHSEEALRRGIPETRATLMPEKGHDQPAPVGFLAPTASGHHARNDMSLGGVFISSNWQFLNSPRWTARIQPWARVGLTASDLDPHDYLLDWRRGGEGLRYVHHFSVPELTALAQATGFEVLETFESDGAEGNLGLYQIWKAT